MSLANAQTAVDPRLPPELEQIIFQVQHLRYRVLLLLRDPDAPHGVRGYPHNDDSELSRLRSLPHSTWRDSVRHLCIDLYSPEPVDFLLFTCSSVENLWVVSQNLPLISALPLKRLHTLLDHLFFPRPIDFTNVLFSRLTHLEIFDRHLRAEPSIWSSLKSLWHLTHLAFHDADLLFIFADLLCICSSWRVLVLISRTAQPPPYVPRELAEEPRFVWMVRTQDIED
ncbi:hypothetical protein FB45DRAFT_1070381 [Roridomyces roridus]|uniref:Uncharacterized protein n=1 Tax=Roridomyces roridus TaxID=1738132 RepID=A0AAD7F950_9AGAR|nr:hypothetical protein FB45DRAFT_1070381 [Roridomyces roridus]